MSLSIDKPRLDNLVSAKRLQLETLDSIKHAIAYKAVTRGIKSIQKTKPSGIDWLPPVPQYWNVKQIQRVCEIVRGKFTHRPRNDPAFYGGEYPFVQTGDITMAQKYIQSYSQTLRAPEINNSTSFLPVGPSPAFHPPAHISICTGGWALVTNPQSAPYCGIIYFRDPERNGLKGEQNVPSWDTGYVHCRKYR